MSQSEEILNMADEAGWTDDTLARVLLAFIDEVGALKDCERYIRDRIREETEAT